MPLISPGALRAVSFGVRLAAGLAAIAIAAVVFRFLVVTSPQPLRTPEPPPPLAVRSMIAAPVGVARVWEGYGTVRAMAQAAVSAQVAGRLVERPAGIEEGVRVSRGELLVRVDPTDYEQRVAASRQAIAAMRADLDAWDIERRRLTEQVEMAESEALVLQRDLERARSAGAGAVAAAEVESREAAASRARREATSLRERLELMGPRRQRLLAQLAGEEAAQRLAEESLARTEIRAPIDGVIAALTAYEGDVLAVGSPVARIVDLRRIEAPLRVPVAAARSISTGDPAELRADSPGESAGAAAWSGTVVRLAPEADPATRTVTAYIEVVQPDANDRGGGTAGRPAGGAPVLMPGRFIVGRIRAADTERKIVVPRRAVSDERVMVVRDTNGGVGRVERAAVVLGPTLEAEYPGLDPAEMQWVVVEEGLAAGDVVITSNLDQLRGGMLVRFGGGGAAAGVGVREAATPGAAGAPGAVR